MAMRDFGALSAGRKSLGTLDVCVHIYIFLNMAGSARKARGRTQLSGAFALASFTLIPRVPRHFRHCPQWIVDHSKKHEKKFEELTQASKGSGLPLLVPKLLQFKGFKAFEIVILANFL